MISRNRSHWQPGCIELLSARNCRKSADVTDVRKGCNSQTDSFKPDFVQAMPRHFLATKHPFYTFGKLIAKHFRSDYFAPRHEKSRPPVHHRSPSAFRNALGVG